MNNKEKAEEIAYENNIFGRFIMDRIEANCLEMAQWKDEQLANCIECLEKEYIKNSGKGLLSDEEIAAKLATLKRIKEEMKLVRYITRS